MLSSIKDKILNVKKKSNLFNNEEKSHEPKESINLNAGGDILGHFQKNWAILHQTNEENAELANKAALTIEELSSKIDKDKEKFSTIIEILSESNLVDKIKFCNTQVVNLYEIFKKVEQDLIGLENLIDESEFENMKTQHKQHLMQYKERKGESLKNFKTSLHGKYEESLRNFDLNNRKMLEERQQVFQEAFKNDLEVYKNFGTIPKLDIPQNQPGALLEEIQLDYNKSELDSFLEDCSTDNK